MTDPETIAQVAECRWIAWKPNRKGCPVPPDTLVHIKLAGDRGDEGLWLRPRPAGIYKWTRASGIIAYAEGKSWPLQAHLQGQKQ